VSFTLDFTQSEPADQSPHASSKPLPGSRRRTAVMIRARAAGTAGEDAVADVIEHLLCEFEDQVDSEVIFGVVLGCRGELTSCPPSALPERIRRLAHRRLSSAASAAGWRSRPVA
jgi:hypothetical protein